MSVVKTPISFSTYSGYSWFSPSWWREMFWYVRRGFWRDIYWFYHRGRYGWSPRDVWNLDGYYDKVMGETLLHMANNIHSAPSGYPYQPSEWKYIDGDKYNPVTDFDRWQADLRRWSEAFLNNARDDYYERHGNNYEAWMADEDARLKARDAALAEMLPWWANLWD